MQSNSYVSAILCPLQTACINNKIHLCPYHPLQDKALGHRYKSSGLKKSKCLSTTLAQTSEGQGRCDYSEYAPQVDPGIHCPLQAEATALAP